ncbi:MAG: hypothetical protein ACRDRX_06065 [Pseudonocardiaceae bacterium]
MNEDMTDTMLPGPAGLPVPRQSAPIDRVTSPNALAKAAGVDAAYFTMADMDDED